MLWDQIESEWKGWREVKENWGRRSSAKIESQSTRSDTPAHLALQKFVAAKNEVASQLRS